MKEFIIKNNFLPYKNSKNILITSFNDDKAPKDNKLVLCKYFIETLLAIFLLIIDIFDLK
jgi:hypothetical protein